MKKEAKSGVELIITEKPSSAKKVAEALAEGKLEKKHIFVVEDAVRVRITRQKSAVHPAVMVLSAKCGLMPGIRKKEASTE